MPPNIIISLVIYVRGHTYPGEKHITITPATDDRIDTVPVSRTYLSPVLSFPGEGGKS